MAGKPVRFHPEAEREYLASLSWYRDRSHVAASDFEVAVTDALGTIAAAPRRWPFILTNSGNTLCVSFPSASFIKSCSRKLLFSRLLTAIAGLATGEAGRESE